MKNSPKGPVLKWTPELVDKMMKLHHDENWTPKQVQEKFKISDGMFYTHRKKWREENNKVPPEEIPKGPQPTQKPNLEATHKGRFPPELVAEAVDLHLNHGWTVPQLQEAYTASDATVYKWVRDHKAAQGEPPKQYKKRATKKGKKTSAPAKPLSQPEPERVEEFIPMADNGELMDKIARLEAEKRLLKSMFTEQAIELAQLRERVDKVERMRQGQFLTRQT